MSGEEARDTGRSLQQETKSAWSPGPFPYGAVNQRKGSEWHFIDFLRRSVKQSYLC